MKDSLIGAAFFFAVWYLLYFSKIINTLFLPPPHEIFRALGFFIISGELIKNMLFTLSRVMQAFGLSILIGIPLGLLLGFSKPLYNLLGFSIEFLRALPIPSLIPLFILVFGPNDIARIAVIYVAGSLIIIVNTCYGVKNSEKIRIYTANAMKMTPRRQLLKVYLPEALPHIFAGLKISLSLCLAISIVVEILMASDGLGAVIYNAQLSYKTKEMYAAIIIAGTLGFVFNRLFTFLEKKIVHWKGEA
ncbi:MAG: ABC transporter permease [Spirochaetes bacterium]|jgi:NitT/TauT family transport system permease protein|nr:ABC transporter permease [Spirochaetota bacterium]